MHEAEEELALDLVCMSLMLPAEFRQRTSYGPLRSACLCQLCLCGLHFPLRRFQGGARGSSSRRGGFEASPHWNCECFDVSRRSPLQAPACTRCTEHAWRRHALCAAAERRGARRQLFSSSIFRFFKNIDS
jgi:hypothetical protein